MFTFPGSVEHPSTGPYATQISSCGSLSLRNFDDFFGIFDEFSPTGWSLHPWGDLFLTQRWVLQQWNEVLQPWNACCLWQGTIPWRTCVGRPDWPMTAWLHIIGRCTSHVHLFGFPAFFFGNLRTLKASQIFRVFSTVGSARLKSFKIYRYPNYAHLVQQYIIWKTPML